MQQSALGVFTDSVLVRTQPNRLKSVEDRIQDAGFQTNHVFPNLRVIDVARGSEGVAGTTQELNGLEGVQLSTPDYELPMTGYTADYQQSDLIESGKFDPVRRSLSVTDLGIQGRLSHSEGLEETSVPAILDTVNVPAAHATTRGSGSVIAILDTGISKSIIPPERRVAGFSFGTGDPWDDDFGHGSLVAAIAAADEEYYGLDGVAPEAGVVSARAETGPNNGVRTRSMVALQDAVIGLKTGVTADVFTDSLPDEQFDNVVINNSWGLAACDPSEAGKSESCRSLIQEAVARGPVQFGMSPVFAAGNLASACDAKLEGTIWTGMTGAMTATAVDRNLSLHDYASRGPALCSRFHPTAAAPTYGVLPWGDGFANFGDRGGGTSAAAPVLSGITALLRSQRPNKDPFAYIRAIESGASNIPLGRIGPFNPYTGFGLLNADRSLNTLRVTSLTTSVFGGRERTLVRRRPRVLTRLFS